MFGWYILVVNLSCPNGRDSELASYTTCNHTEAATHDRGFEGIVVGKVDVHTVGPGLIRCSVLRARIDSSVSA
jgi:hypothetical protein